MTRAYGMAEVSLITPLDFLRLPIAGVLGLVAFNEVPDVWSIAGAVVIIGAALVIARRETR
jgi:drug/metabolite transporter (DMT)-like permease